MSYDAVVIGAGIFGSLISRALQKEGKRVLTVDDRRENAGSPPAACLMRPSWFSSLGKDVYDPALKKLDELVGVQDIKFKLAVGSVTVHWCDPVRVLCPVGYVAHDTVSRITPCRKTQWEVGFNLREPEVVPLVVVATGIWSKLLVPDVEVTAQAGVSWLWPGADIPAPFIKAWAPYKQIVAFNRGDGLWAGDGTSLRYWSAEAEAASLARCRHELFARKALPPNEAPKQLFGYRPYVRHVKPCLLKQIKKGFWIATGGAKNGTLAAGWCADQIVRAT